VRQVHNPPNPFDSVEREWLEAPPEVRVQVFEDRSRSILSENTSPDLPFRWSVNPYRGCFHACAYCYARPTHEYLGFGAGTDFDSKLVVKPNAPELLRAAFRKPSWKGELVAFSGNTDCYQPLEAVYRLTRACLEVCAEHRNPVGIVTKSLLVVRDIDVLLRLQERASVRVCVSIPFADDAMGRAIEPQAPLVSRRFEALRRLTEAGLPTEVTISPIIPGLNDDDIAPILERARAAGVRDASYILLRLPGSAREVFLQRLRAALPDRARRVENRIREVRGGALNDARFFSRHTGRGVYWDMIEAQWRVHARRLGFLDGSTRTAPGREVPAAHPRDSIQGTLFPGL